MAGQRPTRTHDPAETAVRTLSRPLALILALVVAGCAAGDTTGDAPHKEVIVPPGGGEPSLFSPAVRTGGLIFLSGAVGTAPEGGLVAGGVEAETRRVLEILSTRLEAADASLADVVKCTVFLADIADYNAVNEVYREFFPADPPARSAVAVAELVLGAQVEIECFAAVRA